MNLSLFCRIKKYSRGQLFLCHLAIFVDNVLAHKLFYRRKEGEKENLLRVDVSVRIRSSATGGWRKVFCPAVGSP
jgi:hypothetical protein